MGEDVDSSWREPTSHGVPVRRHLGRSVLSGSLMVLYGALDEVCRNMRSSFADSSLNE